MIGDYLANIGNYLLINNKFLVFNIFEHWPGANTGLVNFK